MSTVRPFSFSSRIFLFVYKIGISFNTSLIIGLIRKFSTNLISDLVWDLFWDTIENFNIHISAIYRIFIEEFFWKFIPWLVFFFPQQLFVCFGKPTKKTLGQKFIQSHLMTTIATSLTIHSSLKIANIGNIGYIIGKCIAHNIHILTLSCLLITFSNPKCCFQYIATSVKKYSSICNRLFFHITNSIFTFYEQFT